MKRLLNIFKFALVFIFIVIVAISLLAFLTPQGKTSLKTILFIPQVLPSIPVRPLEWFGSAPIVKEVSYPLANGIGIADVYRPSRDGRYSAVLFSQGVVPGGRYDPRIVRLGKALARSGVVVMIPWSNTQVQNRISINDVDDMVNAFSYLVTLDYVNPEKAGMGGICVGASLSTIAAQDYRIRDSVKFVNFFAGYYDAIDLVKSIGSRTRFYEGYTVPWDPDKLTMQIFMEHLIEGVSESNDRELLTDIFVKGKIIDDVVLENITSDAHAVYKLLDGIAFDEVDDAISKLSPKTKQFLRDISPSRNINNLNARMLIMHDRADRLVNSEESKRLADALSDGNKVYHTEFSFFQREIQVHVGESDDIGVFGYVGESVKLFNHMYQVFRELE